MKPSIDASFALKQTQQTPQMSSREKEALKQSCEDFEAIFIDTLFKAMRKTVGDNELFPKSSAEKMYEEMLDTEMAQQIAQKQSMGLANQIYQQVQKNITSKK
ncbi:rod-binding protein [Desulfogranum japonicum]|uniref:rod-binding protein n=1 Tax=Desulfogranum japonicum TaxID=231447 RepID=UPI00040F0737|nr:rod-binding protein [Desulfogranum japonicum]